MQDCVGIQREKENQPLVTAKWPQGPITDLESIYYLGDIRMLTPT